MNGPGLHPKYRAAPDYLDHGFVGVAGGRNRCRHYRESPPYRYQGRTWIGFCGEPAAAHANGLTMAELFDNPEAVETAHTGR